MIVTPRHFQLLLVVAVGLCKYLCSVIIHSVRPTDQRVKNSLNIGFDNFHASQLPCLVLYWSSPALGFWNPSFRLRLRLSVQNFPVKSLKSFIQKMSKVKIRKVGSSQNCSPKNHSPASQPPRRIIPTRS